jgi:hypothetical protein
MKRDDVTPDFARHEFSRRRRRQVLSKAASNFIKGTILLFVHNIAINLLYITALAYWLGSLVSFNRFFFVFNQTCLI